ncbi:hypothetical protein ACJW31_11G087200 [Castanea mollissima]
MQGHLSAWIAKHGVVHRSLGFDYQGIETLQINVYHLTRVAYSIDQPKEVCIKVFAPRWNPRIPFVFWVWKSVDFQERESYDMLGIFYDNHPCQKYILILESLIGWPLHKDYIAPNFYEIQDAH